MTGRDMDERLTALKRHIASLDTQEYAAQIVKTEGPQAVFALIRNGDALAVACAVQEGRTAELKDENGMTPLHHAAAHDARLIGALLLEETGGAPWARDQWGRLPLDVARESGHTELGDTLERVTYPGLFKDERDGPVPHETIQRFDDKRRQLGSPDTLPATAPNFEARGFLPRSREQERGGLER